MSHMEQWSNIVASRIATKMPRKEESVSHMEQWSNVVASRIATTMPRKEESVSHMAQRLRVNDAALGDVSNTLWGEEFASHMVQS